MRFAWQGFQLEHPDDWAPAVLTGNRSEGYARIASPTRFALQVRWKAAAKAPELRSRLDPYLDRLSRDTLRAKGSFQRDVAEEEGSLVYRYMGLEQGRGCLFYSEPCKRVIFLEASAGRKDSLLPLYRDLMQTFRSEDPERVERWAVLGLDVTLPARLEVEGRKFLTGRTQLVLRDKTVRITAERWGFGEQLVSRHGLADWARAVAEMPRAEALLEEPERAELSAKSWLKHEHLIVRLDADRNQIQWIKVQSRTGEKAEWDWLSD